MTQVFSEQVEVQTIQLVKLSGDGAGSEKVVDARSPLRRMVLNWLPFVVMVVIPTLVVGVYMYGLAASRYVSEVKYVVRSPASGTTGQLASLVQGSSITRATDDAYIATTYMLSRDAMQQLIDHDGLLDMFARAGWDVLWRFPGLFRTPTNEDMTKHYLKFVDVEYDHTTGISTLSMEAFRPEDAQRLAGALITHTESFLNALNERAQQDSIKAALRDVNDAKAAAYKALDAVTAYRNADETVDPTRSSTAIVTSIGALSLETATANARLAELMTSTPQSPEIPTQRSRITALQAQIAKQRQQLGGDANSFAPRIAQYQRLLLDQQFAEKAFISALTSLETARLDAQHQRVFIEHVTTPDIADEPAYPRRTMTVLFCFLMALSLWRVASVLGKDMRSHGKK